MHREYEIEHFGFSPEQSSLERKHFLQKIIRRELDDMVNKFNASRETLQLLNKQKDKVFENIWESISDQITAADHLDRKYFSIPDHVLLPAYFDHEKSYSDKDEQMLDNELEMLRKTFLENSIMLASLKLENTQYNSFSGFVKEEVKVQQQLKESFDSININKTSDLLVRMASILFQCSYTFFLYKVEYTD